VSRRLSILFALACLALLTAPSSALACAACYGASDSPLANGMNMGILVLLGFIGTVLVGISAFFIHLARNSARLAAAQAQIQTDNQS